MFKMTVTEEQRLYLLQLIRRSAAQRVCRPALRGDEVTRRPSPELREVFEAIRDARKAARSDHLDRRIPVLDRDFDHLSFA